MPLDLAHTLAPRGKRCLPAVMAMCLPALSVLILSLSGGSSGFNMMHVFLVGTGTALPFVLAAVWQRHSRSDEHTFNSSVGTGLLTSVLGWAWITLDAALYPAIATFSLSGFLWLPPTILCAMLVNLSLQRAIVKLSAI